MRRLFEPTCGLIQASRFAPEDTAAAQGGHCHRPPPVIELGPDPLAATGGRDVLSAPGSALVPEPLETSGAQTLSSEATGKRQPRAEYKATKRQSKRAGSWLKPVMMAAWRD